MRPAEVNDKLFLDNSSLGLYPVIIRQREEIDRIAWSGERNAFAVARTDRFVLGADGWSRAA